MTRFDLFLAALPPFLAIVLEFFSFPSDGYLARQAARAQVAHGLPKSAANVIGQTAVGAVSMGSLAPTLVSFVTSVFALFNGQPDAFKYVCAMMGLSAVIAIVAIATISLHTPFDFPTKKLSAGWLRFIIRTHFLPITLAGLMSFTIYAINGLLIALAFAIYYKVLPTW